jgi:hypothetical protein
MRKRSSARSSRVLGMSSRMRLASFRRFSLAANSRKPLVVFIDESGRVQDGYGVRKSLVVFCRSESETAEDRLA